MGSRPLLPRALGVELTRLTLHAAIGADARLAHAPRTVRRWRLGRPRTLRTLLAPELAERVLVVRHVILEGAVVEHVGLRLRRRRYSRSCLARARLLDADGAEAGTGTGGIVMFETLTVPSWSKLRLEDGEVERAGAGRRGADRRRDGRRLRIGPEVDSVTSRTELPPDATPCCRRAPAGAGASPARARAAAPGGRRSGRRLAGR